VQTRLRKLMSTLRNSCKDAFLNPCKHVRKHVYLPVIVTIDRSCISERWITETAVD